MEGAARQRRVLALLAVVAAGRQRGVSRDRVLALLWSESEPEKARQALTQSLYHARKALGDAEVFVASADLRLNPEVIASDVDEFEKALDAGELTRAVQLYEGPYLDGFYVNGAPEFERWVTEERTRLKNRYAHALEQLAAAAQAASDHAGAVEWRKRLAALEPLNSRIALELMRAMAAAGDRAGAIRHAQVHAALLRHELNAAPNPAILELAAQLRDTALWVPSGSAREEPSASLPVHRDVVEIAAPPPLPPVASQRSRHKGRAVWIGGAALGLVLVVAFAITRRAPTRRAASARNLTVVAPFRVTGADPALAYLREGMIDLLVAKLTDDSESPAVDAGAVMSAWRQAGSGDRTDVAQGEALRIARQLGGTRLLMGSVVGTPKNLIVNATLLGVDGALRAQASSSGAADSITAILDRLVSRLVAKEAGEWERLASRTSTSVQALRAYIDGQASYRRGGYRESVRFFTIALDRDPTFAMAGLALANAAERLGSTADRARGLRAAWAARAELTMRDSVYLDAVAGPHYPAEASPREQLTAWERAAAVIPDRADVWHELGERLFFYGRILGVPDWESRASAAFRRSAELDPGFASPLQYLVQLAASARDTTSVRLAAAAYLRLDSIGDLAPFVRWRSATARGDSAALRALRRRLPEFPTASLRSILLSAQFNAVGLGDAERAQTALVSRAARGFDRTNALVAGHALALNVGRLDVAVDITDMLGDGALGRRLRVLDALYGGVDLEAAKDVALRLTGRTVDSSNRGVAAPVVLAPTQNENDCVFGQWNAWTDDVDQLRVASPTAASDSVSGSAHWRLCSALVVAVVAARTQSAGSEQLIARFDSLLLVASGSDEMHEYAGLALARIYAVRGESRRALAAVRRRPHMREWPHYLAAHLVEEGQLAAAVGDSSGALTAYQQFVALRRSPTGAARHELDSVRAQIAQLSKVAAPK